MMYAIALLVLPFQKPSAYPKVAPGGNLGMRRYRMLESLKAGWEKTDSENPNFTYLHWSDESGGPTYFLFPIGESNRVFFFTEVGRAYYGGSKKLTRGVQYVSCYALQVDGRPAKMWQVETVWTKTTPKSPKGTLSKFYRFEKGERLPDFADADYVAWTGKTTAFVKYYFDKMNGIVVPTGVDQTGRHIENAKPFSEAAEARSLSKTGLPITKYEKKVMSKR